MNGFAVDTNYSVGHSIAITPTNDTTINKQYINIFIDFIVVLNHQIIKYDY